METDSEAVGRGFPIPHAISIFDDGLTIEEPCDEEYDNMPDLIDVDDEFEDWRSQLKVPHGNNLPCGLSPLEHVYLSVNASRLPQELNIPEELLHNIRCLFAPSGTTQQEVECGEQAHRDMVDDFRAKVISDWRSQKARFQYATIAWMANSPSQISSAVQQWNGPLVDYLIQISGHDDHRLVHDLQHGFPVIGNLPEYRVSARPKAKIEQPELTEKEVWTQRDLNNRKIFQSLSEDLNSSEIWDAVAEEVKHGAMTEPTQVESVEDISDCVVSRRFMVEQVKEKNSQSIQAFRQIDHFTESLINPATCTYEILENDNLDLFCNIVRLLLSNRIVFCMFKEYI